MQSQVARYRRDLEAVKREKGEHIQMLEMALCLVEHWQGQGSSSARSPGARPANSGSRPLEEITEELANSPPFPQLASRLGSS